MDKNKQRRISRRRERAGFYLNIACCLVMVLCLIIGKVTGVGFKAPDPAQADTVSDAAAEGESNETGEGGDDAVTEETPRPVPSKYDFTLSFMGDVNFDDSWATMEHLSELGGDLTRAIDSDMLSLMTGADLFCVNNEFAFTDRGEALEGKAYTFRSNPSNVSLYDTMGVGLVSLANNHIYDFGPEGLTDTLATLDQAGIRHVGAGENLTDASKPLYVDVQDVRLGFVNACNAEVNRFTPEATASSSGVLLCYDHSKFVSAVQEAEANCDYVVAIVHWGRDYVYETSDEQRALARELIDAGADVVIGGHSHSLQGIEYYNNRPIFYSLGSCWFNGKTLETYLLELHFVSDGTNPSVTPILVPAMQRDAELHIAADAAEAQQVTDLILQYSAGIWFDSYVDEDHGGHTVAALHQDADTVDDWSNPGSTEAAAEAAVETADTPEDGDTAEDTETVEGGDIEVATETDEVKG